LCQILILFLGDDGIIGCGVCVEHLCVSRYQCVVSICTEVYVLVVVCVVIQDVMYVFRCLSINRLRLGVCYCLCVC